MDLPESKEQGPTDCLNTPLRRRLLLSMLCPNNALLVLSQNQPMYHRTSQGRERWGYKQAAYKMRLKLGQPQRPAAVPPLPIGVFCAGARKGREGDYVKRLFSHKGP